MKPSLIFYTVARAVLVGWCRLYHRLTVEGSENVPTEGPYILAPVHRSIIDTFAVGAVTRRRLRYMGKEELWKVAWFGRIIEALGAFPVHRDVTDREAFRRCVAVIEGGEPLVLFPEGTRRTGPTVVDLREGATYLAARTDVPIVPVGIGGSEMALQKGTRFPRPVKIHVVVGEPIRVKVAGEQSSSSGSGRRADRLSRRELHEATERLRAELQVLFDQARVRAGA
ncbi:MAG TPA: lysophospholipid acyltransferase family protein [Acidimicrobiales bacterium]|nr:lysophospholipid acyltransferase family protein [Acidimicrobiales bacterium]